MGNVSERQRDGMGMGEFPRVEWLADSAAGNS